MADGLAGFVRRVGERHGRAPVRAAIESMNGARFVHDTLERLGWEVEVADAAKVKGLAPLACKTDRIDAWVLAELSRRDLVPAIWLPEFGMRQERERARWRLFLVRKRSSLKHRVHAQLLAFGHACPVSDLFGVERPASCSSGSSSPSRGAANVLAAVRMIDELDQRDRRDRQGAASAGRRPPLRPAADDASPGSPGCSATRSRPRSATSTGSPAPKKLTSYTGLCPRVYQSGGSDRRGPLTHAGPSYLRWALIEAAAHACRHELYRDRYQRTKQRLGKQRGAKVAQVDLARQLSEAIWHMLTRNQPFAPAGATPALAA